MFEEKTASKKLLLWLLGYVVAIVLVSSLVAPFFYWIVSLAPFEMPPFRRVFNRALMISALLCVIPMAVHWRMGSELKKALTDSRWWKTFSLWFLLGIASLSLLVVGQLYWGGRIWRIDLPGYKLAEIGGTSILVSFLEETLFRGALLLALKPYLKGKIFIWAVLISILFGAGHFIQGRDLGGAVHGWSGFEQWGEIFTFSSADADTWLRFLSLVLVGFSLSCLTIRRHSLWPAIGLHAGWVVVMRLSDRVTSNPDKLWTIWFGRDVATGIPALILLGTMTMLILCMRQREPQS